jgi:hypothetical protein
LPQVIAAVGYHDRTGRVAVHRPLDYGFKSNLASAMCFMHNFDHLLSSLLKIDLVVWMVADLHEGLIKKTYTSSGLDKQVV